GGVRHQLPAEDQDRGRSRRGGGRQGGRGNCECGQDRPDRRREDLRLPGRARHAHPHRRDRRRRAVTAPIPQLWRLDQMRLATSFTALARPALAGMALLPTFAALPAHAQEAAETAAEIIDKGDTAWMMTASLLVLFMTLPG